MSNNNGFNPDRDILISEQPAGVLVYGIRNMPIAFDDLAAAESFLRNDAEAGESADAGAALFFCTFEQPGISEHEIEIDECPDCCGRPGGHGLCVTCCDGWDEYRDEPEMFGSSS